MPQIWTPVSQSVRALWSKYATWKRIVAAFLAMLVGAVGLLSGWDTARAKVIAWFRTPAAYAVLVVLPDVDTFTQEGSQPTTVQSTRSTQYQSDHTVSKDLWNGIQGIITGENEKPSKEYWFNNNALGRVAVIPISDGPLPENTIARLRDRVKPASGKATHKCLCILGHETSTLASAVWRDFYRSMDDPVPVILLGPTNPQITRDDAASGHRLLLRLLPNDDLQIALLAKLLESGKELRATSLDSGEANGSDSRVNGPAHRVLVVADRDNAMYSTYITKKLVEYESSSVLFCGTYEISVTNSLFADADRIRVLRPDTIVFVGMAPAAQAFVLGLEAEWNAAEEASRPGQVKPTGVSHTTSKNISVEPHWLTNVNLVFTDGSASAGFCNFLTSSKRKPWANLCVTTTATPSSQLASNPFEFESVGRAAIMLANYLIEQAAESNTTSPSRVLQVSQARRNVVITLPDSFNGYSPDLGSLATLKFDANGDNSTGKWRVYWKSRGSSGFVPLK